MPVIAYIIYIYVTVISKCPRMAVSTSTMAHGAVLSAAISNVRTSLVSQATLAVLLLLDRWLSSPSHICRANLFTEMRHMNVCVSVHTNVPWSSTPLALTNYNTSSIQPVKILILQPKTTWTAISSSKILLTMRIRIDSMWKDGFSVNSTGGCPSSFSFIP